MANVRKGVLLLNLGGPDSLEAVRPFLFNLFSDRDIIRLGPSFLQKPLAWIIAVARSGKTRENYRLIGSRSPLLDITRAQASSLEEKLNRDKDGFKVYVGMRYWHPFIDDAFREAVDEGVTELVALPLFPHYSRATTGSCFKELRKAVSRYKEKINVAYIESWHAHPLYIKALAESIEEGLIGFPSDERKKAHILFSAHSLPQGFIDEGDPYVGHLKSTIDAVTRALSIASWRLAFQSRSGPVKWIGPNTSETLEELALEGVKNVLMVPISFVSDHIETLYEMDVLYKNKAGDLGINLLRAPSLNTRPLFIEALADISGKALS